MAPATLDAAPAGLRADRLPARAFVDTTFARPDSTSTAEQPSHSRRLARAARLAADEKLLESSAEEYGDILKEW